MAQMDYVTPEFPKQTNRDFAPMVVKEISVHGLGNLLFPRRCTICGSESIASHGLLICTACQQKLLRDKQTACVRCGATRADTFIDTEDCPKCRGVKLKFRRAISLGDYKGELRKVVINMKHQWQEPLTIQMGRLLGRQLFELIRAESIDRLVSVPTFWVRQFTRGANVSELLCEGVLKEVSIKYRGRVLGQVRPTRKQGTLTRTQRMANLRGAFQVRLPQLVASANLLLIDDVMTSGATVNEAAKVLLHAGARKVLVATVARGVGSF